MTINLYRSVWAIVAVTLLLPLAVLSGKLFEAYLENFFIVQTARLMMTEPLINTRSSLQIKQDLSARLQLQGIGALSADQINISRSQSITFLQIDYRHPIVLCGNQIFNLNFSETLP